MASDGYEGHDGGNIEEGVVNNIFGADPQTPSLGLGELGHFVEEMVSAEAGHNEAEEHIHMEHPITQETQAARAARASNLLTGMYFGKDRNIFRNKSLEERLLKPVSILSVAQEGKKKASEASSTTKARAKELAKKLGKLKILIGWWMTKRQSLYSRFTDGAGSFAYAKFVLKPSSCSKPSLLDFLRTFEFFLKKGALSTKIAVYCANMQLEIISEVDAYLAGNSNFVRRIQKNNPEYGTCPHGPPVENVVWRILMDMFTNDYAQFNYELIIDGDDINSHYEISKIPAAPTAEPSSMNAPSSSDNGPSDNNAAPKQIVAEIVDAIRAAGGNARMFEDGIQSLSKNGIVPTAEDSFIRQLINNEGLAFVKDPTDIATIGSDTDVAAILGYFACTGGNFKPASGPCIVEARMVKYLLGVMNRAAEASRPVLKAILTPIGLMSQSTASSLIADGGLYTDDKKISTILDELDLPLVEPSSFLHALKCYNLFRTKRQMEQNGENITDIEAFYQSQTALCPNAEEELYSIAGTIDRFAQIGVSDSYLLKPDPDQQASAINCFPDHFEEGVNSQIGAAVNMFLEAKREHEQLVAEISEAKALAMSSAASIQERANECIKEQDLDEAELNQAGYYEKNHDAQWIENMRQDVIRQLQEVAAVQAQTIDEDINSKAQTVCQRLQFTGMTDEDRQLLQERIKLSFQNQPEDYVVQGTLQIQHVKGKVDTVSMSYISPEAKDQMKASKATDKTPIKWSVLAGVMRELVKNVKEQDLSQIEDQSLHAAWNGQFGITSPGLLELVYRVLDRRNVAHLTRSIIAAIKTPEEAKADAKSASNKKRRRFEEGSNEMGEDGMDAPEAKRKLGSLLLKPASSKKKRVRVIM